MHKFKFLLLTLLLSFFAFSSLHARLEDHFKKAEGKSSINKMKNIDFIYMINLDQRPEKFDKSIKQLNPYGIFPYRFSAVNGWELTLEDINDVGVKYAPGMSGGFMATSYVDRSLEPHHSEIRNYGQVYFVHCLARGTIGIALSHLSILQDALNSGYETIWILEDDIEVLQDPRKLSDLVSTLDKRVGKNNWDILFTDQDFRNGEGHRVPCYGFARRPNFYPKNTDRFNQRSQIDENFRAIGARFGAHSYIIRRSGMEKILSFIKSYQIFLPYDMDFYLPEDIKLFTVVNDVVANLCKAPSDNGGANYLNKKK